jgi:hypothetical protein
MNLETITLTDAQIQALAINSHIKPNLLCLLPDFDKAESVSPPLLDAAPQAAISYCRPVRATLPPW